MKAVTFTILSRKYSKILISTALAFLLSSLILASAQSQQIRKYATRQFIGTGGLVATSNTSAAQATDANPYTASSINVGIGVLGGYIEQVIDFNPSPTAITSYATMIPGTTPITVKLTLPSGLVAALAGLEIQAIKDMDKNSGIGGDQLDYTNVGTAYSGSSLVGLISGTGQVEVTLTPGADYQGIRVRINSGIITASYTVNIFEAHIPEAASAAIACDERIDQLSGVTSNALANLTSGLGSVTSAPQAIDNDENTAATLNLGAQVLNATYLTTIFNTKSKANDSIRIVLQNSTPTVLTLGLLNAFSIRLYDGASLVKTIDNTSSLLNLQLLSGGSDKYVLSAEVDVAFDKIQIVYGGVASLLNGINIYEVNRKIGSPLRTEAQRNIYVYAGQQATLTATPAAGDVVTWYTDAIGGAVATNPITTNTAQSNTVDDYFAEVIRTGCNDVINRFQANVYIVGVTYNTPPATGSFGITYSGSVAATAGGPLPQTPVFTYTVATGTLPNGLTLNGATGAITGTPTLPGTYTFDVLTFDQANNLPVGTKTYTIVVDGILPDLTPIIVMNNSGFINPSNLTRPATLRLYNIAPGSFTFGAVTVYIYMPNANFSLALTGAEASNWTMTYNPAFGGYYTLVSNGSSILYGPSTFVPIGLNISVNTNAANGVYNLMMQVADNAGAEGNNANNIKSVNISISN